MKVVADKFRNELNKFWIWSNQTVYEYAKLGWKKKQEEWEYQNWDILMKLTQDAIEAIANGEKNKELVDCILETMALDNEDEMVLDECEEKLHNNNLLYLSSIAILHDQSEARWQVAELLGRCKNENVTGLLIKLIDDENKYVQRRALLSLSRVNQFETERICLNMLNDADDYLRLVALRMLREAKSELLTKAIDILKNDTFEFIQKEIKEINN